MFTLIGKEIKQDLPQFTVKQKYATSNKVSISANNTFTDPNQVKMK